MKDASVGAWRQDESHASREQMGLTYLRPIRSKCIHVHNIKPARETLVKPAKSFLKISKTICIREQSLHLFYELWQRRLKEAKAVWRIGISIWARKSE